MKKMLFIILLASTTLSCTYVLTETAKALDQNNRIVPPPPSNRFQETSIDDNYQISLPRDMDFIDGIAEEALISYGNHYRELYLVVLKGDMIYYKDYEKSDAYLIDSIPLIEEYKNSYQADIKETSRTIKFEDYGLMEINGYNARQFKLFAIDNNTEITQIVTLIEDEGQVYHIISWTSKEKFKNNIGVMEQIPFTFQKKIIYE